MESRKRKKIGWFLFALSITLCVLLGCFFWLSLKKNHIQQNIQKSVLGMDKEMQTLISKGLNHEELEKNKTGLTVFMSDTLVFWNRNDVNAKLMKRKALLGHDTICSLLSGNYYVKSYQSGAMTYYVYKQINTNYQIENPYFANQNQVLPRYIDAHFVLQENSAGVPIINSADKIIGQYQIEGKPQLKQPYRYLWPVPFALLLIISLILIFGGQKKTAKKQRNLYKIVEIGMAIILLVAILGTYVYYKISVKQENEQMKQLAEKLMEKRDTDFEDSYNIFAEQIKADTNIREMVFAESNVLSEVILGYSKEFLFDETMQAYNATLTLCAPGEEIAIQPEGYITECDAYFMEKLANNKQKRVGAGLHFIEYYTLDPNYLGEIVIVSKDSLQKKTLYFEFYKPIAPEGFGFPQLLQESNDQRPYDYSVASYRENQLVYKYGRYVYPNFLKGLKLKDHDFAYSKRYKHYATIQNENNALVISTPTKAFSEKTAPFAVFFLGLTIPFLAIVLLTKPKEEKRHNKSFRKRLQAIILMTIGISVVVIGPVSVIYMRSIYNQKTRDTQFETTRTLCMEMRNDLDFKTLLRTATKDDWNEILRHYAGTFFTDLNLYQLNGQLLATTRPEIYELNLQAPLMNAVAYQNLYRNKELYFTHQENLGKGAYESAYIPVADENGNTLAYLNTPYFSSTTDLHKEIKDFMLTYINIILILLGVALILILHLTKRLTQPLALIQNKLGDIKIDQKNEPIEWNDNDEIGALVKQYNQLIVELEKSAAELKRTTAESAWRGVARQVAHEIKNSLTPMRLSVQLLQRNIENGKATPEQIQRTTNTLIEQIDALSDIASSFSTYAKLPENHPAPLDLAELVQNVVNLYDNADNIEFIYDYDKAKDHTYNGDKTNLNSAVGNIIKNATQAIGTQPDGRIEVSLKDTGKAFVISVKDNGKGIKEDDKERIFLPNFTTKSGGSGVGLSLTYNIVQAAGGTITFESQEGEGATFVIELPK